MIYRPMMNLTILLHYDLAYVQNILTVIHFIIFNVIIDDFL